LGSQVKASDQFGNSLINVRRNGNQRGRSCQFGLEVWHKLRLGLANRDDGLRLMIGEVCHAGKIPRHDQLRGRAKASPERNRRGAAVGEQDHPFYERCGWRFCGDVAVGSRPVREYGRRSYAHNMASHLMRAEAHCLHRSRIAPVATAKPASARSRPHGPLILSGHLQETTGRLRTLRLCVAW
jgi:hypothetical protein